MNYEEKYKQALERARDYHSKNYMLINSAIENIFPELNESEDERIRKEIVNFITSSNKYGTNERCEAWLNWLEKQVEQKTLNADEVIDWLEKHIIEWKGQDLIKTFTPNSPAGKSYIVEQFKKDFGLC